MRFPARPDARLCDPPAANFAHANKWPRARSRVERVQTLEAPAGVGSFLQRAEANAYSATRAVLRDWQPRRGSQGRYG